MRINNTLEKVRNRTDKSAQKYFSQYIRLHKHFSCWEQNSQVQLHAIIYFTKQFRLGPFRAFCRKCLTYFRDNAAKKIKKSKLLVIFKLLHNGLSITALQTSRYKTNRPIRGSLTPRRHFTIDILHIVRYKLVCHT